MFRLKKVLHTVYLQFLLNKEEILRWDIFESSCKSRKSPINVLCKGTDFERVEVHKKLSKGLNNGLFLSFLVLLSFKTF